MKKEYDSDIVQMCHEEAMALHKLGAISDARMKEFDDMCSAPHGNQFSKTKNI
jgi:DNA-binding transcriptional regulator YiaG